MRSIRWNLGLVVSVALAGALFVGANTSAQATTSSSDSASHEIAFVDASGSLSVTTMPGVGASAQLTAKSVDDPSLLATYTFSKEQTKKLYEIALSAGVPG